MPPNMRRLAVAFVAVLVLIMPVGSAPLGAADSGADAKAKNDAKAPDKATPPDKIDWDRARALYRRSRAGDKLTDEEKAYLNRALELRRQGRAANRPGARPGARPRAALTPRPTIGVKPLTQWSADEKYHGFDGGLYGHGRNTPPQTHLAAAMAAVNAIQPLDANGKPAPDGKVVLISNGMSNTTQEFSQFLRLANADADKSPRLLIVDGAQGGQEAFDWTHAEDRVRKDRPSPWDVLMQRLERAGVSPRQVQVVWIKQARRNPAALGEFPKHAVELKDNLAQLVRMLKQRFVNLRVAYLSSRIYAGYANGPLNPEPYAFESAFSVRWLIEDQIAAEPELNFDPSRGDVKAPVLLWGPYLWADGTTGRKSDGLIYTRDDLGPDGTHPSPAGRQKVAKQLLDFFKSDPTARPWFLRGGR